MHEKPSVLWNFNNDTNQSMSKWINESVSVSGVCKAPLVSEPMELKIQIQMVYNVSVVIRWQFSDISYIKKIRILLNPPKKCTPGGWHFKKENISKLSQGLNLYILLISLMGEPSSSS